MSATTLLDTSRKEREAWRYTDLSFLDQQSFAPGLCDMTEKVCLPPALAPHRLVFVAGCYRPDLSDVSALPPGLLTAVDDGFCEVHAEKEQCLALAPLEILYLWPAAQRATESSTRLALSLGQSARLTLIERHWAQGSQAPSLQEIDMAANLAAQAKLVHGKILIGAAQTIHAARTQLRVAKGAFYDRTAFVRGGHTLRCETEVDLDGEMAEARLMAIQILDQSTHADTTLRVRHNAPHGISRQLVKTVLSDKASAAFQGAVHVAPGAQKTDAHQLSRALLLSNQAEMNAKPELEIFADDVKCSHGSTVGDLDETALFYLRSRGIPADQARAMLVVAFIEEIVDQVQAPELAAAIRQEMERALS